MTSDAYWKRLIQKTPQLAAEDSFMKMKIAAFKNEIIAAYNQGRADEMDKHKQTKPKISDSMDDLFGGIFGGRK